MKRVVAVAGDTVELRDDVLSLDGRRLTYAPLSPEFSGRRHLDPQECAVAVFATERLGDSSHAMMILLRVPARRSFGPVVVPAGHCLVLGDNRDNSRDSRRFGFKPVERIVGRAEVVFVSGDLNRWLWTRFDRFCTVLR